MNKNIWLTVEDYIVEHTHDHDAILKATIDDSMSAGLPEIQVSPTQGKFLALVAQIRGTKRILEIGTLGGYSSIWLGRTLPADGKLISLEADPLHADVARSNLQRAGLAQQVEVRTGLALELLPHLQKDVEEEGAFDFIFIDADKENILNYFEWSLKLTHPGSVIIVDNVVREGEVIHSDTTDTAVQGVRAFFQQMSNDDRIEATALQTVSGKGYDGFLMAVVR